MNVFVYVYIMNGSYTGDVTVPIKAFNIDDKIPIHIDISVSMCSVVFHGIYSPNLHQN